MKMSLEQIMEVLEIQQIGRLNRLDDAVVGITLGEGHDKKPYRFIYDHSLMCEEIKAESPPDLPESIYRRYTTNLIKRVIAEQDLCPLFVKTINAEI